MYLIYVITFTPTWSNLLRKVDNTRNGKFKKIETFHVSVNITVKRTERLYLKGIETFCTQDNVRTHGWLVHPSSNDQHPYKDNFLSVAGSDVSRIYTRSTIYLWSARLNLAKHTDGSCDGRSRGRRLVPFSIFHSSNRIQAETHRYDKSSEQYLKATETLMQDSYFTIICPLSLYIQQNNKRQQIENMSDIDEISTVRKSQWFPSTGIFKFSKRSLYFHN